MDCRLYYDFANNVKSKLRKEVNGFIKYEIYPKVDTVIFKIMFKEFDYSYPVAEVQDIVYGGKDVVGDILKDYRQAVNGAFFKTERRKNLDKGREVKVTFKEDFV